MNFDLVEQALLSLLPGQFSITSIDVIGSTQGNGNIFGPIGLTTDQSDITWVSDDEQFKAINKQRAWILFWYAAPPAPQFSVAASSLQACIDAVSPSTPPIAGNPTNPP